MIIDVQFLSQLYKQLVDDAYADDHHSRLGYIVITELERDISKLEAQYKELNNQLKLVLQTNLRLREPIYKILTVEKEETPGSDVKPEVPDLSMTSDTELKHMEPKTEEEYLYRIRPPDSPDE